MNLCTRFGVELYREPVALRPEWHHHDDDKGGLFVALKGSWNRSIPTGYKIVRVPFKDGRPEGYYENFATGFWASGEERAEVWGRPAALAVAKDGSLLVADDTGGTIWRIAYEGASEHAGAPGAKTQ